MSAPDGAMDLPTARPFSLHTAHGATCSQAGHWERVCTHWETPGLNPLEARRETAGWWQKSALHRKLEGAPTLAG